MNKIKNQSFLFSDETQLLIDAIAYPFLDSTENYPLRNPDFNYNSEQLINKARFHKIRPILYRYHLEKKFLTPELTEIYETQRINQFQNNLRNLAEIKGVLKILNGQNIPCVLMKGNIFIHRIYGNQQLRETSDIDIFCSKNDVLSVCRILLDLGYVIPTPNSKILKNEIAYDPKLELERLKERLKSRIFCEIPLVRLNHVIDLHWDISGLRFNFEFPFSKVLINSENYNFYGSSVLQPCIEDFFLMMILHHGGKEYWTNLRHIADLLAFLKTYEKKLNWDKIIRDSESMNLLDALKLGFFILEDQWNYPTPEKLIIEKNEFFELSDVVYDFWEKCDYKSFTRFTLNLSIRQQRNILAKAEILKDFFITIYMEFKISFYPSKSFHKDLFSFILTKMKKIYKEKFSKMEWKNQT